ncbi:methyltransferase (Ncl1), putative [Talaromyces stipitatus ATCC 10500]|uniref:Methyltransferase (Ncl1), putative n=1 Tax=Talaromyces stipitatus (strain ATCC 10500 / CBS 375.48 / QM 6759 / NRRL 1006) TaxID=441959 RepID=B8M3C1_TALSN|nr:methyltransferase (Ncl1), putative [Talaromyces stipitatus ATCC 10500]EED22293.1 methyltransferase (Ncl1), putative [Talaromyces stipitatus ATCC 10500]
MNDIFSDFDIIETGSRLANLQSQGKKGGGQASRPRQAWTDTPKTNEKYESYYNDHGLIPKEEQDAFWAALRRELPNSFRFTGSRGHALSVKKTLVDYHIPQITSITYEGNVVEPPKPVPWYPDELAWYMTTPKNVIRRFPPFSSFQKFLVSETEVGNITRQEVVSMIPPLFLDVRPGMTVLDMCAAPGSKSGQLMELLHAGEEESIRKAAAEVEQDTYDESHLPEGLRDYGRTTGLLVANDSDFKRAHMLVHQMKRLNSPNLIVTNHDATFYPSIKLPSPTGEKQPNVYLKFDRVLADVPCSGDGTTRKNPNIWSDWSPASALGLHATQMRILVRALQMLKVGGRVVYSTCSMNPIENESVIAAAIERCGGSSHVEIIDCSKELPDLKRVNGLHTWKVMDRDGRIWNSWEEVEEYRETQGITGLGRLAATMFPPTEDVHLERCMRVYPHLQDTGGFFITVLEKKKEIRAKPEDMTKVIPKASVAAVVEELDKKNRDGNDGSMDKIEALDDIVLPSEGTRGKDATVAESSHQPPYKVTLDEPSSNGKRLAPELETQMPVKRTKLEDGTEAILGDRPVHSPPPSAVEGQEDTTDYPRVGDPKQLDMNIRAAKRKPGLPFEEPFTFIDGKQEEIEKIFKFFNISDHFPRDRFMVRNAAGSLSKTIYYTSALARDILRENEGRGIKFVQSGVKMFVKQDAQRPNQCQWRIQTDGLQLVEAWVGPERTVTLTKKETLRLLLKELFPRLDKNNYLHLGEVGEKVKDMDLGCCILRVEPSDIEDGFRERMVIPLWRSMYSVNLMLPKEDRRAMLLRLFNDSEPVVHTQVKKGPVVGDGEADSSEMSEAVVGDAVTATADPEMVYDEIVKDIPTGKTEEDIIKTENLLRGEEQEDLMAKRETYQRDGDEEDRFNTTV